MSDIYGPPTNVPAVLPPAVFAAINTMNLLRDLQDDATAAVQALADAVQAAVAAGIGGQGLDPGQAAALIAAYGVNVGPTPAP